MEAAVKETASADRSRVSFTEEHRMMQNSSLMQPNATPSAANSIDSKRHYIKGIADQTAVGERSMAPSILEQPISSTHFFTPLQRRVVDGLGDTAMQPLPSIHSQMQLTDSLSEDTFVAHGALQFQSLWKSMGPGAVPIGRTAYSGEHAQPQLHPTARNGLSSLETAKMHPQQGSLHPAQYPGNHQEMAKHAQPHSPFVLGAMNQQQAAGHASSQLTASSVLSAGRSLSPRSSPNHLFRLSDFDLLKTLGTGTFGRVYLSVYKGSKKYFAMKVLKKSEVVRLRQKPFDFPRYGTFQDERHLYMLLEYAIGGELFSYLRKAGRFTLEQTKFYASEIFLAIEYLHAHNIAYRDLKPENLLLDARGHVKITDFGFAKIVHDRTWTVCGTPEYLAPEIIQNTGHGKGVDWWALGVLIFEMLAGYPPFYDENHFGVYEKIISGRFVFPNNFDVISKDLVKRLLTVDKSKRLGNLKNGSADVKEHAFFYKVDWGMLLNRTAAAPFVPSFEHPGDTSNFEVYDEVQEDPLASNFVDPFRNFFQDF